MADKILGTLDAMRLKLSSLLKAVLYFEHPFHFTLSWKVFVYPNIVLGEGRGGKGRGGPLGASELLQKWILCYIWIFNMLPLSKIGFQ